MSAGRRMSLTDPDSLNLDDFKLLNLSVSLESTKYAFISMLLSRVLNLKSEALLLDPQATEQGPKQKVARPVELLPLVAVPNDLWLVQEITIRNSQTKTSILREVNALVLLYVEALKENKLHLIDEPLLLSLEKRITEFNFTDFNNKLDIEHGFDALNEAEEYEESTIDENYSVFSRRSIIGMPDARPRPMSTASSKNINRLSTMSSTFGVNKRKFSILGQPSLPVAEEERHPLQPTTPTKTLPIMNALPRFSNGHRELNFSAHSIASGILSKTKIYSKMKKRRELANLVVSTATTLSSVSSAPSYRRQSTQYDGDLKSPARFNNTQVSAVQKAENQRSKHEYYLQTKILGELTKSLVGYLGKSGLRGNLMRLLEFIKNYVFKFILVDICHMIVDYGHHKLGAPVR